MVTVGIVSPGAMGAALGRGWAEGGARVVATVAGRSERTRRLAHGIELLPALDDVVAVADVVVSVVPPGEALTVARDVAAAAGRTGARPLVADLNAVSPATVARIADALAPLDLVDGSISGGPPDTGTTRVYLSGPRAGEVAALTHPRLDVRVVGDAAGAASAVKMSTASVYKGFTALLLHAVAAAEANGVRDVVLDDLAREFPDTVARLAPALASAGAKAHRYVGEMREIADTQEAAGLPRELFDALALVWERVAATPLGDLTPEEARAAADVGEVVRALRRRFPAGALLVGEVLAHHPYGVEVRLDGGVVGVVDVIYLRDEWVLGAPGDFPPLGSRIEVVVLGYTPHGQLRFSTQESDLRRARRNHPG